MPGKFIIFVKILKFTPMETKDTALDILKTAILLERKGKAFYAQAARNAESKSAKEIFEMMAEEEDQHIDFLTRQAQSYVKDQTFIQPEPRKEEDDTNVEILTEQIKKEINAASFEAAAISAAIDFENRAIKVYSDRAEQASDPVEKEMYQMLADWEKGHHKLLFRLNEELKEEIWNDNNFWPF